MKTVDINCDLGEGEDQLHCARDAHIMRYISRCNIACGGHAGNAETMRLSLINARRHQIAAGAHPGYPDRKNFGRISLKMPRQALLASVQEQIQALQSQAREEQFALTHIKLHGALYNDAETDDTLADDLVRMFSRAFPTLNILALANAAVERAAHRHGYPVLREGFMDRRYLNDHQLSPRSMPEAVIEDFDQCLEQALALTAGTTFPSIDKKPLRFTVDSICLHGDNPHAELIAQNLQQALQRAGYRLCR
ncbi:5-oxoprolinase subunit PxpA [Microbulbifer sp. HZ11]|uniref:5-oxoprolinase subunit PxpA n=1 Tax=unclassified Microbulbifer TaxID=2619833 RepID=UPI0005BE7A01|nr:5-oxoprolinase subunit PxpA [Microbulbifer sp. HZ11]